jgi:hypothetical protein
VERVDLDAGACTGEPVHGIAADEWFDEGRPSM